MTTPSPGDQPALPRRVAGWLGTAVAIGHAVFWTLADASFAISPVADPDAQVLWWLLWVLVGIGAATALGWRRRHAFVVCLITAAAAIVAPIGFFAPWWALVWVLITERVRNIIIAGVATTAAIAATLARDYARDEDALLATIDEVSGDPVVMHHLVFIAIGVTSLGLALAVGLVLRSRAAEREARAAERRQSQAARELRTELSRQEERDLIAREMHDTVAHHLALVSLHASALEVTATDPDTDVPGAARSMRTSAQQALEEMRALIASLRENTAALTQDHPGGIAATLEDLPVLIDEARRAGAQVTPTILISDAPSAPPALTRAVYRIVQEGLTNALKHAPGAPVMVDVRAGPGRGVQITITNPLGPPGPTGSFAAGGFEAATGAAGLGAGTDPTGGSDTEGSGLLGMSERVQALGGSLRISTDDGAHVVQADLPWAVPEAEVGRGAGGSAAGVGGRS